MPLAYHALRFGSLDGLNTQQSDTAMFYEGVQKLSNEQRAKLADVLKKLAVENELFRRNVAMYALKVELGRFGRTKYALATSETGSAMYWKCFMRGPWEFFYGTWDDGKEHGWVMKIGGQPVPVPSMDEFEAGVFTVPPDLLQLMEIRERILDEIDGYAPAVAVREGKVALGHLRTALLAAGD